jgi:hypothetical protein
MTSTSGYRVNATHVVSDVFEDGEAAVIDLRTGAYFSLNPTGALLWPLIVSGTTVEALVAQALAGTVGGPAVALAVETFVAALIAEGLVEEVGDVSPQSPAAPNGDRLPFTPPELQRFDDLQELLLLDPIHDVSDQGWPHTPPG